MGNILVEVTRGKIGENYHRGHICILNSDKKIISSIGDTNFITFLRSCAKPIQVIPLLTCGAAEKYNLTEKEITIMSGSLNGQDFQVEILENILKKIKLDRSYLNCGIHPPSHRETRKNLKEFNELHNNCAGKHIAMLILCLYYNFPLENYDNIEHPVQKLILKEISYFTEIPENDIIIGIDGCGVPVFAVPLYNFALTYLKLSNPELILDKKRQNAVNFLMKNCVKYPELIAGDDRICTELMRITRNRLFAKVGADGTYGISIFDKKIGIALKVESGNMRVLNIVVIEILKQLGVLDKKDINKLKKFYKIPVLNHRKEIIGEYKPVFKLFS